MIKQEFLDGRIVIYNGDCLDIMREIGDKEIDLVLTDPPYGISWSSKPVSTSGLRIHSKTGAVSYIRGNSYDKKDWDNNKPSQNIFDEIFRISNKQIIWGENYLEFNQKSLSSGRLFWDKVNGATTFSDGELAWSSAHKSIRQFEFMWKGMLQGKSIEDGRVQQGNKKLTEKKFHPTQKPVALMSWCLHNYSKENDLIFDGFLGSGTTAISCIRAKCRLIGCELDPIYFEKMCERIETELRQGVLF